MQTPHNDHQKTQRHPMALSAREQQERHEASQRLALRRIVERRRTNLETSGGQAPVGYDRPAYNTPEYYRDVVRGWISNEEQAADHAAYETRRKRALDYKHNQAKAPHRHQRQGPRPTKQYAKSMSTAAARDDRLAPQAKALLQVIVARTGRGRSTDTTKTTLGKTLNRCPRSIQRYLRELVEFGYLRTQTIKSRRSGYYTGLRIWILNSVLPFWAKGQGDDAYDAEKWVRLAAGRHNRDKTELSLTKVKDTYLSCLSGKEPPWLREYAWR